MRIRSIKNRSAGVIVRAPRAQFASYDIGDTTTENRRHFSMADGISADAALSPEKRRTIRNRCRYEVMNNSYAKGIGLSLANDTVGSGPTLQMLTDDRAVNSLIETAFWEWATEIRLAEKLRTARYSRYDAGEMFIVFTTNPGLKSPVKLDLELVEPEQIADPLYNDGADDNWIDGIKYDPYGNPVTYRKLKAHPGSMNWNVLPTDYVDLPAGFVWHYYHPDRATQRRGVPDVAPACQQFAELRRFSNAVIANAESVADVTGVLETQAPADPDDDDDDVESWDTIPYARRMLMTLPAGYKMSQMTASQPSTNYPEFINAKLKEIARCLNVPFTVAAMDASVANMSASYVDRQVYANERVIDRSDIENGLERMTDIWLSEAIRVPNFIPLLTAYPHQFMWPSLYHHADPQKVATAAAVNLAIGADTIPDLWARKGADWEEKQQSAAKAHGLTVAEYQKLVTASIFKLAAAGGEPPPDDPED